MFVILSGGPHSGPKSKDLRLLFGLMAAGLKLNRSFVS